MNEIKVVDDVVLYLSKFPGIGEKTARKYAFWLIEHRDIANGLYGAIKDVLSKVQLCKKCRNITTNEDGTCNICKDNTRDRSTICVVESIENLIAIEASLSYNGTYYILGGIVSPLYGIESYSANLDYLARRILHEGIKEVILVISSTLEGDLTTQYIKESLKNSSNDVRLTKIASGIPIGANVNFVDRDTLIEAFKNRRIV